MNKKNTLCLTLMVFLAIFIFVYYEVTNKPFNFSQMIEKAVKERDPEIQELFYTYVSTVRTFAFYRSKNVLNLAVIDMSNNEANVLGSVSLTNKRGFSEEFVEVNKLEIYAAFGMITNNKIKQVYVNNDLCNLIRIGSSRYIWFSIQNSAFPAPVSIEAKSEDGTVLYSTGAN